MNDVLLIKEWTEGAIKIVSAIAGYTMSVGAMWVLFDVARYLIKLIIDYKLKE